MKAVGGVLVSVLSLACAIDGRQVAFDGGAGGKGGTGPGGVDAGGDGAPGGQGGGAARDAGSADAAAANGGAGGTAPCPFGTNQVDGTCAAACGTSYVIGSPIPEITTEAVQYPMGISDRGDILFGREVSPCSPDLTVLFAERTSAGYVVYDLTGDPDLDGVVHGDMALGPDGKLIVLTKGNRSGFLTATRNGGDVGAVSEGPFGAVNRSILAGTVGTPVLSGDQLTFTFVLTPAVGQYVSFQASRATISDPFGAPLELTGDIEGFWGIDALSHDGLTAFVDKDWMTTIFTRARTSDPFVKSDAIPLSAYAVKTTGSCGALVAYAGPGGCQNGTIVRLYVDDAGAAGQGGTTGADAGSDGGPPSSDGGGDANKCPFSSPQLDGRCAHVCGTAFTVGSPISDITTAAAETPMGLSENGDVLFTRDVQACGTDKRILFAEHTAAGYNVRDLTGDPDLADVLRSDMALGLDGKLIVFTKADSSGFLMGTRNGGDVGPLAEGPFGWINYFIDVGNASDPVLSGDQLTFTFTFTLPPAPPQIRQTRRATTADRFPAPVPLTGDIDGYGPIQGLSYDGLTAFVLKDSMTTIFTRPRATEPFVKSSAAPLPATAVKAGGDCHTLVGMTSSGGCQVGDVVTIITPSRP